MGYPDQTPPTPPQGGCPPPQQPQYDPNRSKAIAAMVLGIVSIVLAWTPGTATTVISLILAIVALVLGIQARKAIPRGAPNRGMATAGFVLAIISLAGWVLAIIVTVAAAACLVGMAAAF